MARRKSMNRHAKEGLSVHDGLLEQGVQRQHECGKTRGCISRP